MSTSLLYHSQGAVGYCYARTEYQEGKILIYLRQRDQDINRPQCGARRVKRRATVCRPLHGVPIRSKPVILILQIQRVECAHCDGIRQSRQKLCSERRHYTRAFRRYVLDLCRVMTMLDVARHLQVGWDLVKEILKEDLNRRYGQPRLKGLRQIAIDRPMVLAFFDYPISTGPLEAVNNKIKTMSRQAYGFRDRDFYALKIMAIHEAKFALVG